MNKNMKSALLLLVCCAVWFLLGAILHDIGLRNIGFIVSLVVSVALFYYIYTQKINISDAQVYAFAEQEVDNGDIDEGLWAMALVNARGNENLRKVEYIKLRAKQLQK